MSDQYNGGPAFPGVEENYDHDRNAWVVGSEGGMTLRDYFAAKAMQAFIVAISDGGGVHPQRDDDVAMRAHEMADAMLKAREGES